MTNVDNTPLVPNAYRLLWAGFMAILAAGVGFAIRGGIFDNWGSEFGFTGEQLGAIGGAGNMNGSTVAVARGGDLLLGGYSALPSGGKAPPDAFLMRVAPDRVVQRREGVAVRVVPTKCETVSAIEQRCG